jgi:hypothetical protein
MPALLQFGTEHVLVCDSKGAAIDGRQRALDLIGEALGLDASMIAIPVARLDETFFDLRSGVAGEIAQIAANYRLKLAIVGDVAHHVARSDALRDWVIECNRGVALWFVPSVAELSARCGTGT